MTKTRSVPVGEQMFATFSERLRFMLTGMAYTTSSDDELNAALNWFYFALVLGMESPVAAASVLFELESEPTWTKEYQEMTRENVRMALERAGRYIEGKEAIA